jgi:putative flippase GtrA
MPLRHAKTSNQNGDARSALEPRAGPTTNERMQARGAAQTGAVTIFVRYVLFAIIATGVNLAAQDMVSRLGPTSVGLRLSILAGTAAGFLTKYALDKKWIFDDGYGSHRDEMRKISLYGAFSVVTTLVFWGFEVLFWVTWRTDLAKYTGAVIGLTIGYAAKYSLDRTFVFRARSA